MHSLTFNVHDELTEVTENYLKEIYRLQNVDGTTRVTDIADKLDRKKGTVSGAMSKLKKLGLVDNEKYGKIKLSDKGNQVAEHILKNYKILNSFLQIIGVDSGQADLDACEMEHVSAQSIESLDKFLSFIQKDEDGKQLIAKFIESLE